MSEHTLYLFLNNLEHKNECFRFTFQLDDIDLKENELKAIQLKMISELTRNDDIYYLGEHDSLDTMLRYTQEQIPFRFNKIGIPIKKIGISSIDNIDEINNIKNQENPDVFMVIGGEFRDSLFSYIDFKNQKFLNINEFNNKFNINPDLYDIDQELLNSNTIYGINEDIAPLLLFDKGKNSIQLDTISLSEFHSSLLFIVNSLDNKDSNQTIKINDNLLIEYFPSKTENQTLFDNFNFIYNGRPISIDIKEYDTLNPNNEDTAICTDDIHKLVRNINEFTKQQRKKQIKESIQNSKTKIKKDPS